MLSTRDPRLKIGLTGRIDFDTSCPVSLRKLGASLLSDGSLLMLPRSVERDGSIVSAAA
jgi:hypothetical protein